MLGEWQGAPVEPSDDETPPTIEDPQPVDVPGSPTVFAGEDAVAYRTRFPDPRDGDDERATLELEGLYGRARVWHNGDLLGEHDAYFVPARFPFEPDDDNELVVECRRPTDGFGGVHETELLPAAERVPGIWWGADLRTHGPIALLDLTVSPRIEDDRAVIETTITVDAAEPIDDRITVSVRPEGFRAGGAMERIRVDADAGERTTVTRDIVVRDPQFWWPRELGPQHRYAVRAKLAGDVRTAGTGFCTVERDDDGLRVNGRPIRLRGINVLPTTDPRDAVDAALEANASLLRAHAHVPPPSFHAACDEAGILVWQDLPLTGEVSYDPDRGRELAAALVECRGSRPCVGIYGVHDDPRSPFERPLGAGRLSRVRFRWRAWRTGFDRSTADRVAEAFEDGVVLPVAGPPGTDPDAAHVYPGWAYGDPDDVDWLLDAYPSLSAVVGEFGAGSLVDRGDGNAGEVPGVSPYVPSDDPIDTQHEQARTIKRVAETLRRRESDLLAVFALQDAHEGGGMGVLDGDGHEKAGFGALADSYEPLQAVLDAAPTAGAVGITVLNDTPEAVEATVRWGAGGRSGSVDVSVDALSRADAGGAKIPSDADEVVLTLSAGDAEISNTYPLPED